MILPIVALASLSNCAFRTYVARCRGVVLQPVNRLMQIQNAARDIRPRRQGSIGSTSFGDRCFAVVNERIGALGIGFELCEVLVQQASQHGRLRFRAPLDPARCFKCPVQFGCRITSATCCRTCSAKTRDASTNVGSARAASAPAAAMLLWAARRHIPHALRRRNSSLSAGFRNVRCQCVQSLRR